MTKGIIIPLTEEEFREMLNQEIQNAIGQLFNKKEEDSYLTRKETANRLRISLPSLNEYTKNGKLKGYRINGRVLYRSNEIDTALTAIEPLKYRR